MDIGKKYNFTISISRSKIGNRREECGDTGGNVAASESEKRIGAAAGEEPGERK